MKHSKITAKGQVTVPKEIRDHLHIKPGDRIRFIRQADGTVVLRPAGRPLADLAGALHNPAQPPMSVEDMNEARDETVMERQQRSLDQAP